MPDDKLYYGSGEYTRTGEATVTQGNHLGQDEKGNNTIDTPDGHYVQTGTVMPPHNPDWDRLPS